MSLRKLHVIVLAAGEGRRLHSKTCKVMHAIAGRPLLGHVLDASWGLRPYTLSVVIGEGHSETEKFLQSQPKQARIAYQARPLGTGDAVGLGLRALSPQEKEESEVMVLYGDMPLIGRESLTQLLRAQRDTNSSFSLLCFRCSDRKENYGRVFLDSQNRISKIIEAREATPQQLDNSLCNAGPMIARAADLAGWLCQLPCSSGGEFYLTSLASLAALSGQGGKAVLGKNRSEFYGVNTREDLALAENAWQARKRSEIMQGGVTLTAPETVYFSHDTEIASDTVISPHVVFGEGVRITGPARIESFCHIEGVEIKKGACVGPFARVRPSTVLGAESKIGSFVEVKNSHFAKAAKASHLSYIGDARIDHRANIGAGVVLANYDGVKKSSVHIEHSTFVGSHATLIAPLRVGHSSVIGAGSVVNAGTNIEEESLVLSRPELEVKPGGALRYYRKKKPLE